MRSPVRIYTRYRSRRSAQRGPGPGGSWIYALLCLGLAGLLLWTWWRHAESTRSGHTASAPGTNTASGAPAGKGAAPPSPKRLQAPPETVPATSTVGNAAAPLPGSPGAASRQNVGQAATPGERPAEPSATARPVQNAFEAQVVMAREGISCGPVDGAVGSQTRAALRVFQRKHGLAATGALDAETRARMLLSLPLCTNYIVTSNDLARLLPLAKTWLGKSEQPRLDYENMLELVAERAFSHPQLLRQLNPQVNWEAVPAGTVLSVPNVQYPPPVRAGFVTIHLSEKVLEAFDASTNLLAHFPCSIGKLAEKRPVGELRVIVSAPDPNYTFNPEVFPESEEGRQLGRKLIIPPGPNNPVGTAWIGLDRPGYGIHGTPWPELVGRTESHGCFRLANWNAEYLLKLVAVGTPVWVEP